MAKWLNNSTIRQDRLPQDRYLLLIFHPIEHGCQMVLTTLSSVFFLKCVNFGVISYIIFIIKHAWRKQSVKDEMKNHLRPSLMLSSPCTLLGDGWCRPSPGHLPWGLGSALSSPTPWPLAPPLRGCGHKDRAPSAHELGALCFLPWFPIYDVSESGWRRQCHRASCILWAQ